MPTKYNDYVRVGNIGTDIIITVSRNVNGTLSAVPLDEPAIESASIEVRNPRGTITTVPASILQLPGTNGQIHHVDGTGIFDKRGRWQVRGTVIYPNGNKFSGSWSGFTVGE